MPVVFSFAIASLYALYCQYFIKPFPSASDPLVLVHEDHKWCYEFVV